MTFNLSDEIINNIIMFQENIPVPIIKLVNSFNILVYKDNKMDKDISGAIINEKDIYSIYVNGNEHEHRWRFTVAHELAHFLLHKDLINEELKGTLTDIKAANGAMYRSKLYSVFEKDANKLAAEILMPLNKIKELYSGNNTKDLANQFNVSEQAVKIRVSHPYNVFLRERM